jgi:hypothetical protein
MRGFAGALRLLVIGGCCLAGGCSAGGGGAVDGGLRDAVFEVSLNLPDGCPPVDGNDKGVGTPCTMNGGQCPTGLACTCDRTLGVQLTGVPCFCTLLQLAQANSTNPCVDSVQGDFCGSNATCCSYMTAAAYCVPSICLPGDMCPPVSP